jgi:hypothetical protein
MLVLDILTVNKLSFQMCVYSPGTPVSFTNKTDRHDIIEILLKVALSTIKKGICLEKGYVQKMGYVLRKDMS